MSKKIIVTGGSRGIGKAIAETLLKSGYHVYICARNKENLHSAIDSLSKFGEINSAVVDLSDKQSIKSFSDSFTGMLYGLINNAAVYNIEHLSDDLETWDETLATNLSGVYWLTKFLLPKINNNGRIINIASQLGKSGRRGAGAYCASKFGLIGLTKCWAKELGDKNITVNAVCPGWIKTDMTEEEIIVRAKRKNISTNFFYEQIYQGLELKRMNTEMEIAYFVEFLLSEKASGISGRDFLLQSISNYE